MLEIMELLNKAFKSNDLPLMEKGTQGLTRIITKKLVDRDHDELKKIYSQALRLMDYLEFDEPIEKNMNYYFGSLCAYINLANKLIEEGMKEKNIDMIVSEYPKVRQMIMYLGKNEFATQGDIAKKLNISPNHLWNILNKEEIKNANIFIMNKIGRSKIYSLNERGRQYYKDASNENSIQYSKNDLQKIISFIGSNELVDKDVILKNIRSLDEELIELIYQSYINHLCDSIDYDGYQEYFEEEYFLDCEFITEETKTNEVMSYNYEDNIEEYEKSLAA